MNKRKLEEEIYQQNKFEKLNNIADSEEDDDDDDSVDENSYDVMQEQDIEGNVIKIKIIISCNILLCSIISHIIICILIIIINNAYYITINYYYLNVGQEDGVVGQDGEIRITPFNMQEELEEGHFDKEGMYHWKKDNDIQDNWLENIDWCKVNK